MVVNFYSPILDIFTIEQRNPFVFRGFGCFSGGTSGAGEEQQNGDKCGEIVQVGHNKMMYN